jgi:predicted RecA/RadA family phage recombinase
MKNFIAPGEVLDVVLAANVSSGGVVKQGTLVGIATTDGVIGDTVAVSLTGAFGPVPKATGQAWNQGDKLYWDSTNNNFTTTVGTNTFAGNAYAAALTADTTGSILLANAV